MQFLQLSLTNEMSESIHHAPIESAIILVNSLVNKIEIAPDEPSSRADSTHFPQFIQEKEFRLVRLGSVNTSAPPAFICLQQSDLSSQAKRPYRWVCYQTNITSPCKENTTTGIDRWFEKEIKTSVAYFKEQASWAVI